MLSRNQRYSVATLLCCNSLAMTLDKLKDNPEAMEFAKSIDPLFVKRDGFIPQEAMAYVQPPKEQATQGPRLNLLTRVEVAEMVRDELGLDDDECLSLVKMTKDDLWVLLQAARRLKGK